MKRAALAAASAAALGALLIGLHPAPTSAAEDPAEQSAGAVGSEEAGEEGTRRLRREDPDPLFSIVHYPQTSLPRYLKGIRLAPHKIELVRGGGLVRRIPFDAEGRMVGFEEIVDAIDDPAWASFSEPGVVVLAAAFVHVEETAVRYGAPRVRELRMIDKPGVFIGGAQSHGMFEDIRVTSWDPVLQRASTDYVGARPFVLYEKGARLDVIRSEMLYLGSDRTSSYGVSWRLGGTTGWVIDSVFAHCFFGVYTYEAKDLYFKGNTFRDNVLYGWDPHDHTTGLLAEENLAYGNGSHGFIVSRYVEDSVIRDNYSFGNGGNGIVLDNRSDGNVVEGNRVEDNALDGIVVLGSGHNVVRGNHVAGQRVGIRVNGADAVRNRVRANRVTDNQIGIQVYGGASEVVLARNAITGSTGTGIVVEAPNSVVRGGTIDAGGVGIDARTAVEVDGTAVTAADGVVARPSSFATLRNVTVRAEGHGVRVMEGAYVTLADSTITSRRPVVGVLAADTGNRLLGERVALPSEGGSSWLAAFGVGVIGAAFALEGLRGLRSGRAREVRGTAPDGVWNTA